METKATPLYPTLPHLFTTYFSMGSKWEISGVEWGKVGLGAYYHKIPPLELNRGVLK